MCLLGEQIGSRVEKEMNASPNAEYVCAYVWPAC